MTPLSTLPFGKIAIVSLGGFVGLPVLLLFLVGVSLASAITLITSAVLFYSVVGSTAIFGIKKIRGWADSHANHVMVKKSSNIISILAWYIGSKASSDLIEKKGK